MGTLGGMTSSTWLLTTHYVRPLPEVDAVRGDHVRHLERQRDAGHFVASGPAAVPPTGGFVLARGLDRAALDAVLAEDPYTVAGVAEWGVPALSPTGGRPDVLAALTSDA